MTPHGELWLIRHGETEWSKSGQHTSRTDLPLTPEGERKAVAVGQLLRGHPFALVLPSPMRRARDTAKLAGFEPEITDDLREWDYGEYEGRTTSDIQKEAPGWSIWTSTPPGGETAEQIAARADRVIERVAAGGVAGVGHRHIVRALGARWVRLWGAGRCDFFFSSTAAWWFGGWRRLCVVCDKLQNRLLT